MRVEPLSDGISALIRRDTRQLAFFDPSPPPVCARTKKWSGEHTASKGPVCKPGGERSPESDLVSTLILEFQPPEL